MTTIEVFADVGCPFAHVGLRRFVDRRNAMGRTDVRVHVRSWPLELINGEPMDAGFIAEEVEEIRQQVAPDLFSGFSVAAFPVTSLPALALAAAAYEAGDEVGERVSLALRELVWEQGVDVSRADVLDRLAAEHGLPGGPQDVGRVLADHEAGVARGVSGSPHFFTPDGAFFCPALDIHRDDAGQLHIDTDPEGFDAFLAACFD